MTKIIRFLLLLVLLSLSCNSATDLFGGGGEVTGPIVALATAASLDDRGELVDESYSFAPTAPQVTVVVHVGRLAESSMLTVTWFRVNDQGDEQLFEHAIEVQTLDRAYSIGVNDGVLAPGTYKATAALGDATETILWVVVEAQSTADSESLENAAALISDPGQPPASGGSGKVSASQRAVGQPASEGGCIFDPDFYVNRYQPYVLFTGTGLSSVENDPSPCYGFGEVEVLAAIGSNQASSVCTFKISNLGQGAYGYCAGEKDPCGLDGGSDLPGTTVKVSLRQKSTGKILKEESAVLPADKAAPIILQLISTPSNGANVSNIKEIELIAKVEEEKFVANHEGSWQTGISKIVFKVMKPAGVEEFPVSYAKFAGKSCGEKSWKQTSAPAFKYKVPKGWKDDIIICVFAEDFATPINTSEKECYTYHTVDKAQGKMTSTLTTSTSAADNIGTSVHSVVADLSLTLQADGKVSGTAQITYSFHEEGNTSSCPYSSTIDPLSLTLPVNGDWTEDKITFRITADAPIMATESYTVCGDTLTPQVDVTSIALGGDWQANWDEAKKAYTADKKFNSSGDNWTSEQHWTIHLEPPALPSVHSPGLAIVGGGDPPRRMLTYP